MGRILRISFLVPCYAIVSFLNICFPVAQAYLEPWTDVAQSFALGSFFLLICEFLGPGDEDVSSAAAGYKSAIRQEDGDEKFKVTQARVANCPE